LKRKKRRQTDERTADETIARTDGPKAERQTRRKSGRTGRKFEADQPVNRDEKKEDKPTNEQRKLREPKARPAEPKKSRSQNRRRAKLGKTEAGSAGAASGKSFQDLMWFEIKIFIADFALKEAGFFPRFR